MSDEGPAASAEEHGVEVTEAMNSATSSTSFSSRRWKTSWSSRPSLRTSPRRSPRWPRRTKTIRASPPLRALHRRPGGRQRLHGDERPHGSARAVSGPIEGRAGGDPEAHPMDEDFLEPWNTGCPRPGAWGSASTGWQCSSPIATPSGTSSSSRRCGIGIKPRAMSRSGKKAFPVFSGGRLFCR